MNVVPEHCTLVLEARALDDERAEDVVAEIVDRLHEAANLPDCDCDVDISVQRTFSGYSLPVYQPARARRRAGAARLRTRARAHRKRRRLRRQRADRPGLATVNLANGTERNHEPGERVSALALEEMLDVALALLDEAAGLVPAAAL